MTNPIEMAMYDISQFFLYPVLLAIAALFVHAFYARVRLDEQVLADRQQALRIHEPGEFDLAHLSQLAVALLANGNHAVVGNRDAVLCGTLGNVDRRFED